MDVKRPSSAIASSSSRSSGLSSSRATSKYGTSSKKTQDIYPSPLSPSFTLSTSQPTVHILVTSHSLLRSMNSEHITVSDSLSSYSMHTSIQAEVSLNRSETAFGKTVDGDDIRPIGQLKNSRHFSLSVSDVEASPFITSSRGTEVVASSGLYQSKSKTRETQSDHITPSKTSDSAAFRSSETTLKQPSTRDPPITITESPLRGKGTINSIVMRKFDTTCIYNCGISLCITLVDMTSMQTIHYLQMSLTDGTWID